MGILEIHFHDSEFEFEWEFSPSTGDAPSIPFGDGGESDRSGAESDARTATPSVASKLGSVGMMALVVVGAIAFNRLRSRRARKAAEAEGRSGDRRLSLSRLR